MCIRDRYYAFSTRIGETTYDDGFLERYNIDYDSIEISEGKYKGQRCTKNIFDELRKNSPDTITAVSYTHLDVYKRQEYRLITILKYYLKLKMSICKITSTDTHF